MTDREFLIQTVMDSFDMDNDEALDYIFEMEDYEDYFCEIEERFAQI